MLGRYHRHYSPLPPRASPRARGSPGSSRVLQRLFRFDTENQLHHFQATMTTTANLPSEAAAATTTAKLPLPRATRSTVDRRAAAQTTTAIAKPTVTKRSQQRKIRAAVTPATKTLTAAAAAAAAASKVHEPEPEEQEQVPEPEEPEDQPEEHHQDQEPEQQEYEISSSTRMDGKENQYQHFLPPDPAVVLGAATAIEVAAEVDRAAAVAAAAPAPPVVTATTPTGGMVVTPTTVAPARTRISTRTSARTLTKKTARSERGVPQQQYCHQQLLFVGRKMLRVTTTNPRFDDTAVGMLAQQRPHQQKGPALDVDNKEEGIAARAAAAAALQKDRGVSSLRKRLVLRRNKSTTRSSRGGNGKGKETEGGRMLHEDRHDPTQPKKLGTTEKKDGTTTKMNEKKTGERLHQDRHDPTPQKKQEMTKKNDAGVVTIYDHDTNSTGSRMRVGETVPTAAAAATKIPAELPQQQQQTATKPHVVRPRLLRAAKTLALLPSPPTTTKVLGDADISAAAAAAAAVGGRNLQAEPDRRPRLMRTVKNKPVVVLPPPPLPPLKTTTTTTTTNRKAPKYVDWIGRTIHRRDAAWEDGLLMEGVVTNAYQYQRGWYFRIRYEKYRDANGNADEEDIALPYFKKTCTFIAPTTRHVQKKDDVKKKKKKKKIMAMTTVNKKDDTHDHDYDYKKWIGRGIIRDDADWEEDEKMEGTIMNAYQYGLNMDWYFRVRYAGHFDSHGNVDEEDIGLKEFQQTCTFLAPDDNDDDDVQAVTCTVTAAAAAAAAVNVATATATITKTATTTLVRNPNIDNSTSSDSAGTLAVDETAAAATSSFCLPKSMIIEQDAYNRLLRDLSGDEISIVCDIFGGDDDDDNDDSDDDSDDDDDDSDNSDDDDGDTSSDDTSSIEDNENESVDNDHDDEDHEELKVAATGTEKKCNQPQFHQGKDQATARRMSIATTPAATYNAAGTAILNPSYPFNSHQISATARMVAGGDIAMKRAMATATANSTAIYSDGASTAIAFSGNSSTQNGNSHGQRAPTIVEELDSRVSRLLWNSCIAPRNLLLLNNLKKQQQQQHLLQQLQQKPQVVPFASLPPLYLPRATMLATDGTESSPSTSTVFTKNKKNKRKKTPKRRNSYVDNAGTSGGGNSDGTRHALPRTLFNHWGGLERMKTAETDTEDLNTNMMTTTARCGGSSSSIFNTSLYQHYNDYGSISTVPPPLSRESTRRLIRDARKRVQEEGKVQNINKNVALDVLNDENDNGDDKREGTYYEHEVAAETMLMMAANGNVGEEKDDSAATSKAATNITTVVNKSKKRKACLVVECDIQLHHFCFATSRKAQKRSEYIATSTSNDIKAGSKSITTSQKIVPVLKKHKRKNQKQVRNINKKQEDSETVVLVCSAFTSKGNSRWNKYLNGAKEFVAANGHCRIPMMYAPFPGLGTWARNNRCQYGIYKKYYANPNTTIVTETCVEPKTDATQQVEIDSHTGEMEEENDYEDVDDIVQNENDDEEETNVTNNNIKVVRCHLNSQRIEALDNIGFVSNSQNASWDAHFEMLKAYLKLNNNTHPDKYHGLWKWVRTQRYQMARLVQGKSSFLTSGRINKMRSINFVWKEPE